MRPVEPPPVDEQKQRIEELHHRRREIMARELKAYVSPPQEGGSWASLGAQPTINPRPRPPVGKALPLPQHDDS